MFELNLATFWEEASERAKALPVYRRSHREEEANVVGVLGEIASEWWMRAHKISFQEDKTTTHDYRVLPNRFTLDVKTKDRTVAPKPYYDCSVPLYNHEHQRPDWYLFVSLLRDKQKQGIERFVKAFVLGGCMQSDLQLATTWRAGDTDVNGTTFWTDCLNIRIDELRPLGEMCTVFRP